MFPTTKVIFRNQIETNKKLEALWEITDGIKTFLYLFIFIFFFFSCCCGL